MEEVLTRRLTAYLVERDRPPLERGDKPGRFAYPPQLLVVDGGKGQLGVAERVVRELGLEDEIPVAGLAKRFEEVFVPGRSEPVEIPRGSEALFMLQRIRDEAHRFANTFHGERRSKRMTTSALDGIAGPRRDPPEAAGQGARRRQRGQGGRAWTTLRALPWLPDAVADAVHAKFHPRREPPCPTPTSTSALDDLWERPRRRGGSTASPRAPTPSTSSRSCRWPPRSWPAPARVLDVGCGDGQITRLAAGLDGVELAVGIDPTWNQIRVAAARGGATGFVRAGADGLPFADGSFDAVVACLVFEHIDDVDAAIAEIARVLAARRAVLLLPQPPAAADAGQRLDRRPGARPARAVLAHRAVPAGGGDDRGGRAGVHIRFVHRPLSRYVNALAAHGLLLERMVEPAPPPGFLALAAEYTEAATVPRLLYLRARKVACVT